MLYRVKYGEVHRKYCPMDNIIRDYFTNSLLGFKVRKFKGQILNVQSIHNKPFPPSAVNPHDCFGNLIYD